ncbi:MAG: hypothetical protein WAW07_15930 [Bacteroidales bacterium]
MRKAKVYMHNELAGLLIENEESYSFKYEENYLTSKWRIPPLSARQPVT